MNDGDVYLQRIQYYVMQLAFHGYHQKMTGLVEDFPEQRNSGIHNLLCYIQILAEKPSLEDVKGKLVPG